MYKIVFFVPPEDAECVKMAMFSAGAGRIGAYDHCCWQVSGRGQFRPLAGSRPAKGELNRLEVLEELRIEMVCEDACLAAVLQALLRTHPYETPAFEYWAINPPLPPGELV